MKNKMSLHIGDTNGKPVVFDLPILLRTRLLIQANSGGGKSYALRRLIEEAYGKVQIVIVDTAGEFGSLREKFDFVLIGDQGEAQPSVRSAGLLATRLLELRANAIIDLYGMKAQAHEFVRAYFEATMTAPKKLWHPVLFIVDEAHKFMPEKGEGESVAKQAMLSLCSDGRKYGFCAVLATQRLAKLDKSGASELLNVLIGPTFIDIDLERAHRALGIVRHDWRDFDAQMKTIDPGNFWALGRAVSKDRILVKIGGVKTTHPEAGEIESYMQVPPTPDSIKKLLPQLSDLPQEAERKAKTEDDLRKEIIELRKQLQKSSSEKAQPQIIKVPVFDENKKREIDHVRHIALALLPVMENTIKRVQDISSNLHSVLIDIDTAKIKTYVNGFDVSTQKDMTVRALHVVALSKPSDTQPAKILDGITAPQQRILDSVIWLRSVGLYQPNRNVVAFLSNQSPKSSGFTNNLGALRSAGLIVYPTSDTLDLTVAGVDASNPPPAPLTTDELQAAILSKLPRPQANILKNLIDNYPNPLSREATAIGSNQSPTSSGFTNNLGALRSLGVIDYPDSKTVVALPVLFLE